MGLEDYRVFDIDSQFEMARKRALRAMQARTVDGWDQPRGTSHYGEAIKRGLSWDSPVTATPIEDILRVKGWERANRFGNKTQEGTDILGQQDWENIGKFLLVVAVVVAVALCGLGYVLGRLVR